MKDLPSPVGFGTTLDIIIPENKEYKKTFIVTTQHKHTHSRQTTKNKQISISMYKINL